MLFYPNSTDDFMIRMNPEMICFLDVNSDEAWNLKECP
jgi:hypothetical protein